MNEYLFFLGSHPTLSAIEIAAALRRHGITADIIRYTEQYVRIRTSDELPSSLLANLGGTTRIASLLRTLSATPTAEDVLEALAPLPAKMTIGFSNLTSQNIDLKKLGIEVKKSAKKQTTRVKFITPSGRSQQLNAAQVLFNSLYKQPHAEVTFVEDGDQILVTRTIQMQDISRYELRDTLRPARDPRVGMLPPKLAQIMVNIAISHSPKEELAILDPFCGSGTLLQEAWLMDIQSVGSDASSNMIAASGENLAWIFDKFSPKESLQPELVEHDARQPFPETWSKTFSTIATEPFLGTPQSTPLPMAKLDEWQAPLIQLYIKTFEMLHPVLMDNGIILFLFPAVKTQEKGFTPLPSSLFDEIEKCGYSMVELAPESLRSHVSLTDRGTYLYARPDALVAREFTLWKKI